MSDAVFPSISLIPPVALADLFSLHHTEIGIDRLSWDRYKGAEYKGSAPGGPLEKLGEQCRFPPAYDGQWRPLVPTG